MGIEKRRLKRTRRRLRVRLGTMTLFTSDVSMGGFCIEAMRVQKPGTDVSGVLLVDDKEFPFTGKISWARAGDPRLNQRGRMGVQITGIDSGFYTAFGAS